MQKKIIFGSEAKARLIEGINILADAVGSTLGPKGRNVLIETKNMPILTKDGVTVASHIALQDATMNMGAQIVKQAAAKSAKLSGDGTTTSTVLAQSMINHTNNLIKNNVLSTHKFGYNEFKQGIETLTYEIVNTITKDLAKEVTENDIFSIAYIASNNDLALAEVIDSAYKLSGTHGTIFVQETKSPNTTVEVDAGYAFDRGYISPYFITDQNRLIAELENPFILIYDKKIKTSLELAPLLEIVAKQRKPLYIIADDIEGQALSMLVYNNSRGAISVAATKPPAFSLRRKDVLKDLALLTGATVIDEDLGLTLSQVTLQHLGTCDKVIIEEERTIILTDSVKSNKAKQELIDNRVAEIQKHVDFKESQSANSTDQINDIYTIEKLRERIAKLSGALVTIKLGAVTEVELQEKKDRLDDALKAVRSAKTMGIIPGGGSTLLHISNQLQINANKYEAEPEAIKLSILYSTMSKVLAAPFNKILSNAEFTAEEILKIREDITVQSKEENIVKGFDAKANKIVNMYDARIIDPVAVVTGALTSAISVANQILMTDCAIEELIEPQPTLEDMHISNSYNQY